VVSGLAIRAASRLSPDPLVLHLQDPLARGPLYDGFLSPLVDSPWILPLSGQESGGRHPHKTPSIPLPEYVEIL
jgi:hypothetical protein